MCFTVREWFAQSFDDDDQSHKYGVVFGVQNPRNNFLISRKIEIKQLTSAATLQTYSLGSKYIQNTFAPRPRPAEGLWELIGLQRSFG